MSLFEKYFSDDFVYLKPETIPIESLLTSEKYLLISGDFFGIQKFIFEGLSTKNASKVLRAKSAYIQIFTRVAAYMVCDALGIDKKYILSSSAGKFEIISPVVDEQKVEEVQQKIDAFFVEHFFALSGVGISAIECSKREFGDKGSYRTLRERLSDKVEKRKYHKFDLQHRSSLLTYEEGIDNASLCRTCNMRKITHDSEDRCGICHDFVKLGEMLTKKTLISFVRGRGEIEIIDGYGISFKEEKDAIEIFDIGKEPEGDYPHWALSSYVCSHNGTIATFEELSENSCADYENGIKALAVLKGDVDGMGEFIRTSDVTASYENFDIFSKSIDGFFSKYISQLMTEKYPDTYTVFSGGDDLFLIGAWDEVLDLAREIESDFKRFTKGNLSISMGIILVKPSTPISYLAEISEEALEAAKEVDGKDAITLFGESVKFASYRDAKKFYTMLREMDEDVFPLPTAFLYRLMELLNMRRGIDADPLKNGMWKSKLSYSFRRNVFDRLRDKAKIEKAEALLMMCNSMIEKHPKESKLVLSEFIYKRRKAA